MSVYYVLNCDGTCQKRCFTRDEIPFPEGFANQQELLVERKEKGFTSSDDRTWDHNMTYKVYLLGDQKEISSVSVEDVNKWTNGFGIAYIVMDAEAVCGECADAPKWTYKGKEVPDDMWPEIGMKLAQTKHIYLNTLQTVFGAAHDVAEVDILKTGPAPTKEYLERIDKCIIEDCAHPHSEVVYTNETQRPRLLPRSEEALTFALDKLDKVVRGQWPDRPSGARYRAALGDLSPYHFDDPTLSMDKDAERMSALLLAEPLTHGVRV